MELTDARNNQVKQSAPAGQHDDLVLATAYAWMGISNMGRFPRNVKSYAKGSAGDILGHAEVWRASR